MGLFNKKRRDTGEDAALADEIATLRAVLANYPPGYQLRQGDRCECPRCGSLSFVTVGSRSSSRTHHECVSCGKAWVITDRAIEAVEAENAHGAATLLADAEAHGAGRPLQVLLVEDDPDDAAMVQNILALAMPTAVQVIHVDNRRDAEAAAALGFDVVLLDLNLPDSAGLTTAVHFAAACPGSHVCVYTGDSELAVSARSLGRPILHKHQLVGLVERRHQGTAELLAVLRTTSKAA